MEIKEKITQKLNNLQEEFRVVSYNLQRIDATQKELQKRLIEIKSGIDILNNIIGGENENDTGH